MACNFLRTVASVLFILVIFSSFSEARELLVGGKSNAWKIPSSQSDSLNHWAENSRFLIGDSLVWEYDETKDSVLQVTKRDYVTCNTSTPIETYNTTKVKLERSGPYYFISGAEGHCEKGQKLIVVVMSIKHHRRPSHVSPAPSPAELEGPWIAPAPSSGVGCLRGGGGFLVVGLGALLLVVL
ncbi:hypothetical protein RD792_008489 [Penstemon davidsonii]|uniref:Phytocyanin domain-containing protein n=1 Tax=Penstemon davidsonii TaxID=160366 RepID=A0ABR0D9B0_9LAMI|nr:hypothetical protein RD792_008489 [Penstemon davidsonii]